MSFTFNPFTGNFDKVGGAAQAVFDVNSISAAQTLTINQTYLVDTSGGAFTITLPTPVADGYVVIKDKGSASSNNITVARAGTEQIDGTAASLTINSDYSSTILVSDGTNWFIV